MTKKPTTSVIEYELALYDEPVLVIIKRRGQSWRWLCSLSRQDAQELLLAITRFAETGELCGPSNEMPTNVDEEESAKGKP